MITQEFKHPSNRINQPNIELSIDGSCCGKSKIRGAVFSEHRQSFYYWSKWQFNNSLVTIDWHEDLRNPSEQDKYELENLDFSNDFELFQYTMFRMSYVNDTQIMSAIWSNRINNVYVLTKNKSDEFKIIVFDRFKNKHLIYKTTQSSKLLNAMVENGEREIILDIDLDYFTISNPANGHGYKFTYMSRSRMRKLLHPLESEFMKFIFLRLSILTIALEPLHTGGLMACVKLLRIIKDIWTNEFNIALKECDTMEINKILN